MGKLCPPHHDHLLDKQITAIALIHSLTVVINNEFFLKTGVKIINTLE